MPGLTRRGVQLSLGVLWLLDAGLQTQPYMFTRPFADDVSAAGDNQPVFVAGPVHTLAGWFGAHPAIWNSGIVAVQAVIGLGLLTRRFARPALAASAIWALSVWWLGEGLDGIATGGSNLVSGAPGPALLYGVLALAAWPSRAGAGPYARHRPQPTQRPARWIVAAWGLVWLLGAALQLLPDQRASSDLAARISAGASNAPAWLGHADFRLARVVGHAPDSVVIALAAVEAVIGLAALIGWTTLWRAAPVAMPRWLWRLTCVTGVVLALASWALGQGLGGFTSGQATDPGTGPILALMGVAALAAAARRPGSGYSPAPLPAGRRAAWA